MECQYCEKEIESVVEKQYFTEEFHGNSDSTVEYILTCEHCGTEYEV